MTEPSQRVAVECPACSPTTPVAHECLAPGGQATVRCTDCGHVHKVHLDETRTVERRVIVSQEGESFEATVEAPVDESVAVGEEFLLETDEAVLTVRITSLEVDDQRRTDAATVSAVRTFWTRAVGNVSVNVTLHPKSGSGAETRSLRLQVPGDESFVVGEPFEYAEETFTVEGIHVRDDASGYDRRQFEHHGDRVQAKDVQRVYARDETTSAWSAW